MSTVSATGVKNAELLLAGSPSPHEVARFSIVENISAGFSVSIALLARDASLDLEALVEAPAGLRLSTGGPRHAAGTRTWSGVCAQARLTHAEPTGASGYQLVIVPAVQRLEQRRNHRIFHHLSLPEIVAELLEEWAVPARWLIDRPSYPKVEQRAQYGETDLAFSRRLLAEAGIAFVFEEVDGATQLLLTDAPHTAEARAGTLAYAGRPSDDGVAYATRLTLHATTSPDAVVVIDTDHRRPSERLLSQAERTTAGPRGEEVSYRPGATAVRVDEGPYAIAAARSTLAADDLGAVAAHGAHGQLLAARLLAAEHVDLGGVSFETNALDLRPGAVVQVRHPHQAVDERRLLVTAMALHGTAGGRWSARADAVFADRPYHPPPLAKPSVRCVQSATVVGPAGDEIHTDEHGRVRVQFPWDRVGKHDEHASCWVRTSQGWAGTGWGMQALPRVGQEVMVAFEAGDPDRPVVLGRAFNAAEVVPYPLPARKTVSGLKSRTSPVREGCNELRFEDATREERVYLQAERNHRRLVRRDDTATVGHDRDKLVQGVEQDTTLGNRTEVTGGHRSQRTHGSLRTQLGGSAGLLVNGALHQRGLGTAQRFVGGDAHDVVAGASRLGTAGGLHERIGGGRRERVDGDRSASVGGGSSTRVTGRHATRTGGDAHVRGGALVLEGAASVTLAGPGGNFVRLGDDGITVRGKLVLINSGGAPRDGHGAHPRAPERARRATVDEPLGDPAEPPEKDWVEIEVLDEQGQPLAGQRYVLIARSGEIRSGTVDERGWAREEGVDAGTCRIELPDLERNAFRPRLGTTT